MMWKGLTLFCLLLVFKTYGQKQITGLVSSEADKKALVYAHVYIPGTSVGVYTAKDGRFSINIPENAIHLVCSYVGYENDTIAISDIVNNEWKVMLKSKADIEIFEVESRRSTTSISAKDPLKVELMSEKELRKAACCNLSESFETNPSVDLSFTDAITGTRQIMMLGLGGKYTLTTFEMMPDARTMGANLGLALIPGPWVSSIHVSKGTGGVQSGTESLTGQINYELKKPEDCEEKVFINGYANNSGRFEANVVANTKVKEGLHTSILAHANTRRIAWDMNQDGFLDAPLQDQINVMNRWKFDNGKNFEGVAGLWLIQDSRNGGQLDYETNQIPTKTGPYGIELNTRKFMAFGKFGFLSQKHLERSLGLQLNYTGYLQNAYVGLNHYNAQGRSMYANLIFQDEVIGENVLKAGITATYDESNEYIFRTTFLRSELIVGPHAEYHIKEIENWSIMLGARYDYHNQFGGIFTPRVHLKWDSWHRGVMRASLGRGSRTASIFNENLSFLATARQWNVISDNKSNTPYGLQRESLWNYGWNVTQQFTLDYRDGYVSIDVYRVDFENQIVVDMDQAADVLYLYNLDGRSFSNSIQITADYEIFKYFDLRVAYRYVDVQTEYKSGLERMALVPVHRGLIHGA
jgi:outer membrane receptor for ferrienterochelin and colicins